MYRVCVVGATGYAGAELVRILTGHPEAELTLLTSRQYAGVPFSQIYPALTGVVDRVCEPFDAAAVAERSDIVFTALPHQIPMTIIPALIEKGKRVIDLSADFRFKNLDAYEAFYQPHSARELTRTAVYGLCEIETDAIRGAKLIGNPGCYPTSVLLPLVPLVREGRVDPDSIIADSKSGVSGAGRSASIGSLFCEVQESFKAYKVGTHRHTPEMEEVLGAAAGRGVTISFTPHLVPLSRGMLTTIYAAVGPDETEESIRECLNRAYAERPFVRIRPEGESPDTRSVRGTNYCDIGIFWQEKARRVLLISAIDNLVKGAAGQAVQNMNLMCDLDERTGLDQVPFPL